MDGRVDGRTGGWMDGCMGRQTDRWMDVGRYVRMCLRTDGRTHACTYVRMDGWIDGLMDVLTDGWVDRQTDEQHTVLYNVDTILAQTNSR